MSIASAIATLRAQGAKVSTVFYDHEPDLGQWHYSINLRDCTPHGNVGAHTVGAGQFYPGISGSTIVSHREHAIRSRGYAAVPAKVRREEIARRAAEVESLLMEISARIEAVS